MAVTCRASGVVQCRKLIDGTVLGSFSLQEKNLQPENLCVGATVADGLGVLIRSDKDVRLALYEMRRGRRLREVILEDADPYTQLVPCGLLAESMTVVCMAVAESKVAAYNTKNGRLVWNIENESVNQGMLVSWDGAACATFTDDKIIARNSKGKDLWTRQWTGYFVEPCIADGTASLHHQVLAALISRKEEKNEDLIFEAVDMEGKTVWKRQASAAQALMAVSPNGKRQAWITLDGQSVVITDLPQDTSERVSVHFPVEAQFSPDSRCILLTAPLKEAKMPGVDGSRCLERPTNRAIVLDASTGHVSSEFGL